VESKRSVFTMLVLKYVAQMINVLLIVENKTKEDLEHFAISG
jgi:hypothetical protein